MTNYTLGEERLQKPLEVEPFHQWLTPDGELWTQFFRIASKYLLRFPNFADFFVSPDGKEIVCYPTSDVSIDTLDHLFQNQVLPLSQGLQGLATFHASAVEINNEVVAFIGTSGRGKSTLAMSFALGGARLLTDDGLILEILENHIDVLPGHSSVRLWQDSENFLVGNNVEKAPNLPFTSKTRFLAGQSVNFCSQRRPLRCAFFLGEGNTQKIEVRRLGAAEAMLEWAKHSFLMDIQDTGLLTRHFDYMAHLAQSVDCYLLDYPREYEKLAEVRKFVINQCLGKA